MIGLNSGLLGVRRVPTVGGASGLWVPNEQSLAKRAAIWPTTGDLYFADVSLLLHMDGSNGSTTFTDSSSNALTVTANGNAQISTAQSKFGGASGYFDGTGDYLTIPDNDVFEPGSSDLTWEFWIKTTSSSQYATLYSRVPSAFSAAMWTVMINIASATAGDVAFWAGDYSGASPLVQTSGVSIRDDVWHHVAIVRNGSSWTIYVDGTSCGTGTWSGSIGTSSGSVFIGKDEYYNRDYNGYIDDLRITKGVARYTANFTPPTAAFPNG